MATRIESKRSRSRAAFALALVVTMAACGGSRAASGATDQSTQTLPSINGGTEGNTTPADKSYCSPDGMTCIDPSINGGTAGYTPQADKSYCSADRMICIEP